MSRAATPASQDDWQILRVLSVYRIALAGLLVVLFYTRVAPHMLGNLHPGLFQGASYGYLAAAAVMMFVLQRSWPPLRWQTYLQFITDAVVITTLAYASAGVPSGLGTLLITPTVACALILNTRLAMLMASTATVLLFGAEAFRQFPDQINVGAITQTGILGGILMITAIAGNLVATRARASEARAREVGTELANMARLNENIVEMLQTGVIVLDADHRVRLINAAATTQLAPDSDPIGLRIEQICPRLADQVSSWESDTTYEAEPFEPSAQTGELIPRLTRLGWGENAPTLILLEDTGRLRAQAQQMKLAALGRLSASIAHEIRNPLSAISQAGQLMEESGSLGTENQRLVDMVRRHAARINRIVGDVLSLSRRDSAVTLSLPLQQWLTHTLQQYQESHAGGTRRIELPSMDTDWQVRFDPDQLNQVLVNLLDNAFEHAGRDQAPLVRLAAGRSEAGRLYLEVSDNGRGIPEKLQEQIYEPFFTTAHSGTGLGLFMARELCEYNRARLSYRPSEEGGACFRILFAPDEANP